MNPQVRGPMTRVSVDRSPRWESLDPLESRGLFAADFFPVITALPQVSGAADVADLWFQIANRGATIVTPIGWQGFLSADNQIGNSDDILLGFGGMSTRFLKGARVPVTASVPFGLAGDPSGDYYFGVRLDITNAVTENREDNNVSLSALPVLTILENLTSVAGTAGDDVIRITPSRGSYEYLYVDLNGTRIGAAFGGFSAVLPIDAGGGNDFITVDTGAVSSTSILGGEGDDTLIGGLSRDRLFGGPGHDLLEGRGFDDYLEGGSGADRLAGHSGEDTLLGGGGNDRLDGGRDKVDELFGGAGNDLLYSRDAQPDLLSGGRGSDTAEADASELDALVSIEALLS